MRRGDWSRLHADDGARKAALRPWSNVLAVGHRRRAGAPPKTPQTFLPHRCTRSTGAEEGTSAHAQERALRTSELRERDQRALPGHVSTPAKRHAPPIPTRSPPLLCRRRQRRVKSVPSPSPSPPSPQPRSPPGLGDSRTLPPPPSGTLRAARVIDEQGGPIDRGPPTPTLSSAAAERPARPRRAAPRAPRRARRARIFAPRWARCRACATARRRGGSAPHTDD